MNSTSKAKSGSLGTMTASSINRAAPQQF